MVMHQNCGDGGWLATLYAGNYPKFGGSTCDNDAKLCTVSNCKLPEGDLSSFELPAGLKATLYDAPYFKGASITYRGPVDVPCLVSDGWNDRAQSIKVEPLA